jgi:hypothetical protein
VIFEKSKDQVNDKAMHQVPGNLVQVSALTLVGLVWSLEQLIACLASVSSSEK